MSRRRYILSSGGPTPPEVYTDTIVSFENDRRIEYATVEIKGDFPEGTQFEVTRCGRNLFDNFIVTDRRGNANGVSTLLVGGNKFVSPAEITFYYYHRKFIPCKNKNIVFTASDDFPENRTTRIGLGYNIEYANGDGGSSFAVDPFYCTNNVSIIAPRFDPVTGNNYPLQVNQQMLELGSIAHPYEPYQGDTYTIPYNTPTKIPLLDGVNTFFADEDVNIQVTV